MFKSMGISEHEFTSSIQFSMSMDTDQAYFITKTE